MNIKVFFLSALFSLSYLFGQTQENKKIIISDDLELVPLSEHVFLHTSYMESAGYGRFPCNGLVFVSRDSAIIIDTPVNDSLSVQLLSWLNGKGIRTIAVIPTHWHNDNLGGLKAFHEAGIRSYAYSLTLQLAAQHQYEVPQVPFSDSMNLQVGREIVKCKFLGAGHSLDNIVVWIPSERILFGGCLVRAAGSVGLGYTADGNVEAWPNTILEVMKEYPDAAIVIPGHGLPGGKELLWHTYQLLRPK